MDIKQLNTTELQVMKCLWEIELGFMKDIVNEFPEPKPAYTTISTLLSRMCTKKYIGFNRLGRDKQYFPILKKKDYFSNQLQEMVSNFFNDSSSQFASFFAKNANFSIEELEQLEAVVKNEITQKKK